MNARDMETVLNNLKKATRIQKQMMEKTHGSMCDACVQSMEMAIRLLEEQAAEGYEPAYKMGYKDGYIAAVKEMGKRMRGMKWYGGRDNQEKRAD